MAPEAAVRGRLESIDVLRGVVMAVMVLDHARDFFGEVRRQPLDLASTTPALFFTRWITHFCAPTFVFLAGAGVYLYGMKGRTKGQVSWFLLSRGLWLIFLELTAVRLGLTFDLSYQFIPLTVIWAIGASMVAMSALVFLPTGLILAIGLVLIVGHNATDGVTVKDDLLGDLWRLLHQQALLRSISSPVVFALYPLVPWVGVVAAGYGFGSLYRLPPERRRPILLGLGAALIVGFVALRASNVYGDPSRWMVWGRSADGLPTPGAKPPDLLWTFMSFVNCAKYPPSLLFLMMTLGPAIGFLGLIDGRVGPIGRPLVRLGRVPLFYYVLQWWLLHAMAIVVAMIRDRPWRWLLTSGPFEPPEGYGSGLPFVYAMWLVALAILYPASAWFAGVKARRKDWWLGYL